MGNMHCWRTFRHDSGDHLSMEMPQGGKVDRERQQDSFQLFPLGGQTHCTKIGFWRERGFNGFYRQVAILQRRSNFRWGEAWD